MWPKLNNYLETLQRSFYKYFWKRLWKMLHLFDLFQYFGVQSWSECYYGKENDTRTKPFQYGEQTCLNEIHGGGWTNMIYEMTRGCEWRCSRLQLYLPLFTKIENNWGKTDFFLIHQKNFLCGFCINDCRL